MMPRREIRFRDRVDAGRQLAEELIGREFRSPHVFALPRGGVPVAFEVAEALEAPLDVVVARKVGMPGHPEYAIAAVAEGSRRLVLREQADRLGITTEQLEEAGEQAYVEVERRVERYRGGRPLPDLQAVSAILVDDGLATGATAEAALHALHAHRPHEVVLAVPVCAADSAARLSDLAEVVCLSAPEQFHAVGLWYHDFSQTTDEEVLDLLGRRAFS